MKKLIWWSDYTTEDQDEQILDLEEEDHDIILTILQEAIERAYMAGYQDGRTDDGYED